MRYAKSVKAIQDLIAGPPAIDLLFPMPEKIVPPAGAKAGDLIQETPDGWLYWIWSRSGTRLVQTFIPKG